MIVGIGIDVVDIDRFERTLARTPRLRERLFSVAERDLPPRSLAARYAAKEALIKALGGFSGATWHDMRVVQDAAGKPDFELTGGLWPRGLRRSAPLGSTSRCPTTPELRVRLSCWNRGRQAGNDESCGARKQARVCFRTCACSWARCTRPPVRPTCGRARCRRTRRNCRPARPDGCDAGAFS